MRLLIVAFLLVSVAYADEPQITKQPQLTHFVEAQYPPNKKDVAATVEMSVDIDAEGKVGEVAVTQSAGPEFDAAATTAVKQFVFTPAEIDGKPGPVQITYRYAFKVRTEIVKLKNQVNFEGVVRERFSKRPLSGVKVRVKDLDVETTTDDAGAFDFIDVPPGHHIVELSHEKLVTVSAEEAVEEGKKKSVVYRVEEKQEGVDEERVTRAPRIKRESVETVIRTEEARRIPGTQGDTLKVVQNLPGVARSALGSGALVVWGAAPRETKTNIDGVEIPSLYHVGGLRSTVNGELVRSIDLVPGAYSADYARGLGGLVKIETKALPDKGVHGYAQADAIDSSAMATGAISDRVRVAVAGRYSYLDAILGAITSKDSSGQQRDITQLIPIPRYYDWQAMLQVKLRHDEQLEAVVLSSSDHLVRSIITNDPTTTDRETTDQTYYRAFLRYTRLFSDGGSAQITPSFGWDKNGHVQQFGLTPVSQSSTAYSYGLRASYRKKMVRFLTLSSGLDLRGQWQRTNRFGSLLEPPREGDPYVFGRAPGGDINSDNWVNHTVDVGPYAFAEIAIGKRLTITPGLRIDAYFIDGNRSLPPVADLPAVGYSRVLFAADPRLQVAYRAHKRVLLSLGVGLFHQAPDPEDLSAVFGNPQLGLASAVHVSLGASVRITPTLTFEAVGFYKDLWGLAVRSELPTPTLAHALTQDGIGRAYGGQFLLRQELFKNFFGWITYSVSRSQRKDHADVPWRLLDYDQTHALTIIASYEYKSWTFGTRFRYSTGFPRTPVVGAYWDSGSDTYQPLFGRLNSIRIPYFAQLDIRVDKTFTLRRASLNVYLDAQNITARKNPEEIVYNFDYTRRGYITGLPILATLGLKVQW